MHIISASRRTDIPAFYMPWLMQRLREGYVCYPHPYGGGWRRVSLRPEDVHSIVFWSKDYRPLLQHLDALEALGYRFYFHYTITGLPRPLEPGVPSWEQMVPVFRALAARTSPLHVQWRFDPILFTDELGAAFYLRRFAQIAEALAGATTRCYFSFATLYPKVQKRLLRAGIRVHDPPLEEKIALVERLAERAAQAGITLYACCQDALLSARVRKAHCIDGDLLAQLFPDRPLVSMPHRIREQCGCVVSQDVGAYDTCPHGCLYCYANSRHALAVRRYHAHRPHDVALGLLADRPSPTGSRESPGTSIQQGLLTL